MTSLGPSVASGTILLLLVVTTTGCGSRPADQGVAGALAAASTRPAAKETCADVVWQPPRSLVLEQRSRELVPFTPTLLGVQSTWEGDGFSVETVAGGYVDDVTEPYDNLVPTGTLALRGDPEASILHGSLQSRPVLLVLWRDGSQPAPCDVHAFLVEGADAATESVLVEGLR